MRDIVLIGGPYDGANGPCEFAGAERLWFRPAPEGHDQLWIAPDPQPDATAVYVLADGDDRPLCYVFEPIGELASALELEMVA